MLASVLLPLPLGPMTAWTSPGRMTRWMPLRIWRPSTPALRLWMARMGCLIGRAGLVLDPRRGILHLDVGKGVRAALVADEQRVALREVAGVGRALQDFHQAPIAVLAVASGDAL